MSELNDEIERKPRGPTQGQVKPASQGNIRKIVKGFLRQWSPARVLQALLPSSPLGRGTVVLQSMVWLILLFEIGSLATFTANSTQVSLDRGPGGPILLVTSSANPFTKYYAEILRAEGLNAFAADDISHVSKETLQNYDVVILGEMPLTADQTNHFEEFVSNGGNLIVMRPDKTNGKLMDFLGLAATTSTVTEGYLLFTSSDAGNGLVNQPIQFHGAADVYHLKEASSLATLYSNRTEATGNPAITWRNKDKGHVAAFTFDLARSVVYTRQGNPAWEKQLRDRNRGCLATGAQPCSKTVAPPIRSYNLFYGNAAVQPQNDWVDLNNHAIPQADEQQRFLANLILLMNANNKPLPRFWYFPHGKKAVVIMTGDGHEYSTPNVLFDRHRRDSPADCSVADWECVRSTAFVFPRSSLTNAQAAAYEADGFEISIHANTSCADWTSGTLRLFYLKQLMSWRLKYSSLPAPSTNRTHCVVWSDYATQPIVEREFGIRLDTTYYTYPDAWLKDRPGLLTGSGMPMRFAQKDGTMIDVYQVNTHLPDDSPKAFPLWIDTLLDRAIGPEAYYGAFTTNVHGDSGRSLKDSELKSDAVVTSALSRGVPIVSAKQMLTWLNGRNASTFKGLAWKENVLSFTISTGDGTNGIQAMLPSTSLKGQLVHIERNGTPIAFTRQVIKGIDYAFFSADTGTYSAKYTETD